jgi:hypothetical protein
MKWCDHCQRRLTEKDLLERESQCMEAERAALDLEGVRFRYYSCPHCGHDNLFLEIVQLPGETGQDRLCRKEALAVAAQEVKVVKSTIRVIEQVCLQG